MNGPVFQSDGFIKAIVFPLLIVCFCCINIPGLTMAEERSSYVGVGVIVDKKNRETTAVVNLLEAELKKILGSGYQVYIPKHLVMDADWSETAIKDHYKRLTQDRNVNFIIGLGILSSAVLAQQKPFLKPVMVWGVIDPQMQKISLTDLGTSGVPNFTYIYSNYSVEADIKQFYEIYPFKKLGLLINRHVHKVMPVKDFLAQLVKRLPGEYVLIEIDENLDVDEDVPQTVDAVALGGLFMYSEEKRKKVIAAINRRKLPSYSFDGEIDVRDGILAGSVPIAGIDKVCKRMALNVEMLLSGHNAADLSVYFDERQRLMLNLTTAHAIDFSPTWDILMEARIYGTPESTEGKPMDLESAIHTALNNGRSLLLETKKVNVTREEVNKSTSQFWPKLSAGAAGVAIDQDLAGPAQAERMAKLNGSVSQLIYSDGLIGNIEINRHNLEGVKSNWETVRLDLILNAATAYFDVLKAVAQAKINRENVKLIRKNLEITKFRKKVGYSGAADVYRWESELAAAMRSMISAGILVHQTKLVLCQVIGIHQDTDFQVKDISLSDPPFSNYQQIESSANLKTPKSMRLLSEFLVGYAMQHMSEIQQLDAAIAARKRILKSAERSRLWPTVALSGEVDHVIERDGVGAEMAIGDDTSWNAALSASWNLYQGGEISASVRQAKEELERLRLQKQDVMEKLELGIRTRVLRVIAAGFNIDFSQQAASAAKKNLALIQDAYQKGTVSVVELADAQTTSFQADQASVTAGYDYMNAILALERSVGRFLILSPLEDQKAFFDRFKNKYADKLNTD